MVLLSLVHQSMLFSLSWSTVLMRAGDPTRATWDWNQKPAQKRQAHVICPGTASNSEKLKRVQYASPPTQVWTANIHGSTIHGWVNVVVPKIGRGDVSPLTTTTTKMTSAARMIPQAKSRANLFTCNLNWALRCLLDHRTSCCA